MYQQNREAFYTLVEGLLGMLTDGNLWIIVGPFVTMGMILFFIRWSAAKAKGERLDNLGLDIEDSIVQTQTIVSPGYSSLRQQGLTTREIARLRRQQPGAPLGPVGSQHLNNRRMRIK